MKKNESLAQYFLDKKSQIIKFFILVILFFFTAIVINQNYKKEPFIAKIYLEGMITSESNLVEKIDQLKQKQNLKGILLTINSPGGTFVSSKEIYDTLKFFDEKIPVAIYMKEVATSGAYLVSLGADQIFANTGTITGSVGVILQTADISVLLNKIGISPLVIKSGDLKAIPNPLEKTNDEQIKYIKNVVLLMQEEFSKIVKLERELTWDNLEKISDGRIFTGNQAKEINLIDEIGAENDAIDWIKKKAGLDDNIKIIDYAKEDSFFDFLNLKFLKKFNDMNVKLNDGILALWIP
ncbi:MAG: signal peptide peptidase SppA [Alphaproteobacteria bacterium]